MNFIHSSQYKKVIKKYIFGEVNASEILSMIDIGCGGGKVVNIFSRNAKNSKIYGIDHSSDMVGL